MKLYRRIVKARLRTEVSVCEQRYGFMPKKNKTDAVFALGLLMENYRQGQSSGEE